MFPMSDGQFQLVYNILSFSLASMMATTLFLWMKVPSLNAKYQTAVIISGLVTFIAAYHYMRIFNSWTEAYHYSLDYPNPQLMGTPFNDASRYMGWLLTVPMLLTVRTLLTFARAAHFAITLRLIILKALPMLRLCYQY